MDNLYFIGDTHFGHANVIKYCDRPFADVEEMDEALIANWNSVVKATDTIYHLGDFSFSKTPEKYFHRLNGKKHLIKGNHDRKITTDLQWDSVQDYLELKIEKRYIVLCHYAFKTWNRSHYSSYNLFGHSHGTMQDDPNALAIDVGVDCHNYTPISLEEIDIIMAKKKWKPVDHHKSTRNT